MPPPLQRTRTEYTLRPRRSIYRRNASVVPASKCLLNTEVSPTKADRMPPRKCDPRPW